MKLHRLGYFPLIVACVASLYAQTSLADVRLPRLVSDGLVLQRDKPLEFWGWADEGEHVRVQLGDQQQAVTAEHGRWSVHFAPVSKPGAISLVVDGHNRIVLNDVLMGDVWVAAGQSNMELPLYRIAPRYPHLIAQTHLPDIREFNVPTIYAFKPREDFPVGQWKTATPENLAKFSAVGFFFAKARYEQDHVPVGLITVPVGGSPAEAWMSESALQAYPQYLAQLAPFKDEAYVSATIAKDKASSEAWYGSLAEADQGNKAQPWTGGVDDADWQTFQVPGYFKDQSIAFENGVAYLRKHVSLTAQQAAMPATLVLGALVDGDETYINGERVGATGYQYPPRIYTVKPGVLHEGDNWVAIRLTSYGRHPGFVPDKEYALRLGDSHIDLRGNWRYKKGADAGDMAATTTLHYQPAALFNAKLSPVLHTAVKGVIWFQGESNVTRADEYVRLFPDLIRDWRQQFQQGDLPFIYVQLANFQAASAQPQDSGWAALREAQRLALALPNTGMAVALDIGEWNDIHPLNKQAVGERLSVAADWVLAGARPAALMGGGPLPVAAEWQGKAVAVSFKSVGKGLIAKGEASGIVHQVAVAGADKHFVWAQARLQGNRLLVSSSIAEPAFVRYAWADNPEGANLYNRDGYPASSFELPVVTHK